jgi:hypothetical protein
MFQQKRTKNALKTREKPFNLAPAARKAARFAKKCLLFLFFFICKIVETVHIVV